MAYTVQFSDTGKSPIIVAEYTLDTTSTSISLLGKHYDGYGTVEQNNVLHMLENFANSAPPVNPIEGQLWFDNSTGELNIYKDLDWALVSSAGTVTAVAVQNSNGFSATIANATSTPTITMKTTVTGLLKGNGTAILAAADSDVTSRLLTGYSSGAGTVAATDSILGAIQKLNGNIVALGSPNESVTTVSVVSTNGFSGTVANATTTPAITIRTTISGLLKGNGTAISAATNADVTSKLLTGYSTPVAGTITSTNTILEAIEILQGNITASVTGVSNVSVVPANGFAGTVTNPGTIPAITITTNGITAGSILKTNGTAISAALDTDITGKLITGYSAGAGTITGTDTILQAIGKLQGNITASVSGVTMVSFDNVATNANGFTGSVFDPTGSPTITIGTNVTGILKGNGTVMSAASDADITGKLLTGYSSGSGTVAATDTILGAIQKLDGNISDLDTEINNLDASSITTGVLPIVRGGTGQTTANAALDALSVYTASVAAGATTDLSSTGETVQIINSTTITSFGTGAAGLIRNLIFNDPVVITYNATSMKLPGVQNLYISAGDTATVVCTSAGNWKMISYQTNAPQLNKYPTGYLYGMTLSYATGDTINISTGTAANSDGTQDMIISTDIGKQINNTWVDGGTVGTPLGGRASGVSLTSDTWYRVFAIVKPDGTTNVGFDSMAHTTASGLMTTAAVISAGYIKYRLIGFVRYGASAIVKFWQTGLEFIWDVMSVSYTGVPANINANLLSVLVPPSQTGLLQASLNVAGAGTVFILLTSPIQTNTVPSISAHTVFAYISGGDDDNFGSMPANIVVDSSSQIRYRTSSVDINNLSILTIGWKFQP